MSSEPISVSAHRPYLESVCGPLAIGLGHHVSDEWHAFNLCGQVWLGVPHYRALVRKVSLFDVRCLNPTVR